MKKYNERVPHRRVLTVARGVLSARGGFPITLAILLSGLLAIGLLAPRSNGPTDTSRYLREDRRDGDHRQRRRSYGRESRQLESVMLPIVQVMNRPCRANDLRIEVVDESEINAANAGNCQFYVTTGLLQRADLTHLRGVLAHEIAHQDLGHVAKAQLLGAGLSIGVAVLDQLFPGTGSVAPIAGAILQRSYSRSEELNADRHGVELLQRAGYRKEVMVETLLWLRSVSGNQGGGFLSTHPAIDDRVAAIRKMR